VSRARLTLRYTPSRSNAVFGANRPEAALTDVPKEFSPADLERWSMTSDTPVGRLHYLGPVVRLSETPPRWARPSVPLGYNEPLWPARAK
jgi:hypothetical protein